jgi:hypothetical protein
MDKIIQNEIRQTMFTKWTFRFRDLNLKASYFTHRRSQILDNLSIIRILLAILVLADISLSTNADLPAGRYILIGNIFTTIAFVFVLPHLSTRSMIILCNAYIVSQSIYGPLSCLI